MDERQWIHIIQKGNRKAAKGNLPVLKECLQEIAEEYYDDIYRFCAFQSGSREDAYDLAQETFLRFIRYVESYHDRNLKGYLLTIAMNVCRNYMAEKGKEKSMTVSYEENWQQGSGFPGLCEKGKGKHGCSSGEKVSTDTGRVTVDKEKVLRTFVDMSEETDFVEAAGGKNSMRQWVPELSEPESYVIEAELHDRLMAALAVLPEMQRETILFHYMYGMKYREIGKRMGVNVSTVKSRIRQGMEKLKKMVKREDFECQ